MKNPFMQEDGDMSPIAMIVTVLVIMGSLIIYANI